jgi:hypothetical protein
MRSSIVLSLFTMLATSAVASPIAEVAEVDLETRQTASGCNYLYVKAWIPLAHLRLHD